MLQQSQILPPFRLARPANHFPGACEFHRSRHWPPLQCDGELNRAATGNQASRLEKQSAEADVLGDSINFSHCAPGVKPHMDEVLLVETTESAFSRRAHSKALRRARPLYSKPVVRAGSEPTEADIFFWPAYHVVVSRAASGSSRQRVPSMAMESICSESIHVASLHLAVRHFVLSLRLQAVTDSLSDLTEGAFAFREKVRLCPELGHARAEIPPLTNDTSARSTGPLSSTEIWRKILFG